MLNLSICWVQKHPASAGGEPEGEGGYPPFEQILNSTSFAESPVPNRACAMRQTDERAGQEELGRERERPYKQIPREGRESGCCTRPAAQQTDSFEHDGTEFCR